MPGLFGSDDEDYYSGDEDDAEQRVAWGDSSPAKKNINKTFFGCRAAPALVADFRSGEPLGQNVLLFSNDTTTTSTVGTFEEQEDGSMALPLNVRAAFLSALFAPP